MELSEWREELARETCSASREHSGGSGYHDADRWGPCSGHERMAREVLASPAMARLLAEVRAEAWDDGVRKAVSWLQADYPYGDMPDWRQSGVDWLLDRRLEHRTATNAHPTDDHAGEAK